MMGKILPLAPALALAFALVGACADAGGTASTTIVRDSAGIEIVESSSPAWVEGEAWQLAETPSLTIGVLAGDPNYQLFQVTDALRLDDGRIAIANSGTAEFRIYDEEGKFLLSGGGEGEGPGEFSGISAIHAVPGDSLLVYDQRLGRLSVFDTGGGFGRSFQLSSLSPSGVVRLEDRFTDGALLLSEGVRRTRDNIETGLMRPSALYFRFDPATGRRDTIGVLAGAESLLRVSGSGSTMQLSIMRMPFMREGHIAVAGDRVYYGASDKYQIAIFVDGSEAGADRLIRREHSPAPVEGDYMAAQLEEMRADAEASQAGSLPANPFAGLPLPETLPAYSGLIADSEGNLWVETFRWPGDDQPRWDIFDPNGAWLGTVETPPDFRPTRIGADYVLGISRDEFDIEQVKLYDLRKS